MRGLQFLSIIGALICAQIGFCLTGTSRSHQQRTQVDGREAASRFRSATFQSGSPWPKFHRDVLNSGIAGSGGSNGLGRWNATVNGEVYSSPAIGSDGTIYVGSEDGNLYAFGASGAKKWSFQTNGIVESTPAIGTDGTIYFSSDDGNVYALTSAGTQVWAYSMGSSQAASSPTIGSDGTIYAGSLNTGGTSGNSLYALTSAGKLKWSFPTGGILSSPALGSDGTIYVGSVDGKVYAVNPDGSSKWEAKTAAPFSYSSPAVAADGTIYIGGAYTLKSGEAQTALLAFNPDGSAKWACATGDVTESGPAIGPDGVVYIGSMDFNVYAVSPSGTLKWSFATQGSIDSAPAVGADGTVFVGSMDNYLYALNPNGSIQWKYKTTSLIESSPAIDWDGVVYVGSDDFNLYAIGTEVNTVPIKTLTVSPTSVTGGESSTGGSCCRGCCFAPKQPSRHSGSRVRPGACRNDDGNIHSHHERRGRDDNVCDHCIIWRGQCYGHFDSSVRTIVECDRLSHVGCWRRIFYGNRNAEWKSAHRRDGRETVVEQFVRNDPGKRHGGGGSHDCDLRDYNRPGEHLGSGDDHRN